MIAKSLKFFLVLSLIVSAAFGQVRLRNNFNANWKFALGDHPGAVSGSFDDRNWRSLTLPHDWSIEGKFDEKHPAKPEGGGLPTGIAWYRKSFSIPAGFAKKNWTIEFDGIYKNSSVYLNGHLLGTRPYGYSSFAYNLNKWLKTGNNVLSVRVDNAAQPDSRWYSGSGIYRNVWLTSTARKAIAHWGTFVQAEVTGSADVSGSTAPARVSVAARLINQDAPGRVEIQHQVVDAQGKIIARASRQQVVLRSGETETNATIALPKSMLWSLTNPYLYKMVTLVSEGGRVIDRYETPFGIRKFAFDAKTGFSLNGRTMKINGVCLHHDLGALGAAINTRAIERQLEIMKEMGANAIRTAHNPPAPELLDLCDKMGLLVMDEAFDMWRKKKNKQDYHLHFDEWHTRDLQDMVIRDRNHPSVILWSIGNEIREQFDSTGIALTRELVSTVKKLDRSRPVISALTETDSSKNFIYQAGVLDIYGLNYNHKKYRDFPKNYPGQKFLATETTSALATRGFYDMPVDTIRRWPRDGKTKFTEGNKEWAASSYDHISAYWGSTHEETLKEAKRYDHVSGIFVWTGFDYLGEPLPYPWPARSSYFGIVDLAGFPKDAYYLYQSEWTNKPVLHLLPHWNWKQGDTVEVWAYYSQAEEAELYLNGRSLGKRSKKNDDLHVSWRIPFEPGTLKAVSRKNGTTVLEKTVSTAGKPAQIRLSADRTTIKADQEDLSFITVDIVDEKGNLVPDAEQLVTFRLEGPGSIAGVDNGFQASVEPFKANYRKAYRGKCLVIVRPGSVEGSIKLTASADGLPAAQIVVKSINQHK
ncbi:glycoside hydrolase family 2 TIM barrel-domain containing protein [Pedobacter sp. SYP-B3415]|uniref:glycoside hydrolase family 2 TIM barrel-domain containing protein n=1 Tax=Pedobacter sp. SYP-B3415 TaxID=2496641 RepID=UPI00101CDA33|nr:glycoside hydrolase family 2 TIM barrel-domain containing protein [Pedobacter sp. SYP-B3415]